jgi:hypothetical protein
LYDDFRKAGIDDVMCLSVNDAFTMDAWGRDLDISHVRLLPDGNAEFSRAMGMCVDKRELGFGERSWRYAMVVDDGVIEKTFIEPERPGDPYEVSDADTVLAYVAPDWELREDVAILTREGCPHCARAKSLPQRASATPRSRWSAARPTLPAPPRFRRSRRRAPHRRRRRARALAGAATTAGAGLT